jgi:hypothetical protein
LTKKEKKRFVNPDLVGGGTTPIFNLEDPDVETWYGNKGKSYENTIRQSSQDESKDEKKDSADNQKSKNEKDYLG